MAYSGNENSGQYYVHKSLSCVTPYSPIIYSEHRHICRGLRGFCYEEQRMI